MSGPLISLIHHDKKAISNMRLWMCGWLQGHDNLHVTLAAIAHRNFYSIFEFFSPANALLLWKLNVFRKHYSYIKGVFTDARLRSAFTFQVGSRLFFEILTTACKACKIMSGCLSCIVCPVCPVLSVLCTPCVHVSRGCGGDIKKLSRNNTCNWIVVCIHVFAHVHSFMYMCACTCLVMLVCMS